MGLFFGTPRQTYFGVMGLFFWTPRQNFHDFLKTKKMRNVCTINLAAVSRRDLCYVSENESFCFGQKNGFPGPGPGLGFGGGGEM